MTTAVIRHVLWASITPKMHKLEAGGADAKAFWCI